MNIQEAERMLERFYQGETTLKEEKALKDFFLGDHIPDELRSLQAQFLYYESQRRDIFDSRRIESQVMEEITGSKVKSFFILRKGKILLYSGIAAAILIFLGVYLTMNPVVKKVQDTYSDPMVAYNQAKEVLLYVSAKLNKGTKDLDKIGKLDQQREKLSALGQFDKGLEEANKIKKYNKIERIFGTKN